MNKITKITPVLIVKNEEEVLEDYLHSLKRFEEVVIDFNNSTDAGEEIAARFTNVKITTGPFFWLRSNPQCCC